MDYLTTGSRSSLFEYLLIASPGREIYERVMEIKRAFAGKYNQPLAAKTKPHITVSNFVAMDRMEDTLIRWMQRAVAEQECFVVQLNNYSGFPGRAIFLRVQNPDPFRELAQRLKAIASYIKEYHCPPPKFVNHPHMTIAKNLSPELFEKAIWEFSQKEFAATFGVKELLLLRKQYGHYYEKYKEVAVLNLSESLAG
ncbi:MAG: 2'-5' RNA ligase family protein [Agriterribacter sp.]